METCKHGSGGGCRKPNRAICQGADSLPHELDRSGDCGYWLVIHSGSRRLGTEIAAYYQKTAFENCPDGTPFEFAYAAGPLKDAYLHDMEIAQHFAELNRQVIASGLGYEAGCGGRIFHRSQLHWCRPHDTAERRLSPQKLESA